jgi:hypothetical protein
MSLGCFTPNYVPPYPACSPVYPPCAGSPYGLPYAAGSPFLGYGGYGVYPSVFPYNPLAVPYAAYPTLTHSLGADTFHRGPHGFDAACPWFWMLTVPTGLLTLTALSFQLEEFKARGFRR